MNKHLLSLILIPLLGFGAVWSGGMEGAIGQESVTEKKVEADRLLLQGMKYRQTNQDDLAIRDWEEALKIYRALQERRGEASVLNNLGITYGSQSQHKKSILYFQQALPIFNEIQDFYMESSTLMHLGIVHRYLSQYSKSISFLQMALKKVEKVQDSDRKLLTYALINMNIGNFYDTVHQSEKSIIYHEKSLKLFRELDDYINEAKVLSNLGSAYLNLAQKNNSYQFIQKSIESYENSLSISRRLKDYQGEGKTLHNIGQAYSLLSKDNEPLKYYNAAFLLLEKSNDEGGKARTLLNIGNIQYRKSEYNESFKSFQKALIIFKKIGERDKEALVLNNLSVLLATGQRYLQAEQLLLNAADIQESFGQNLSDDQQISLFDNQTSVYQFLQFLQVFQNKGQSALETSDRGRARAFVELLAARLAGESIENRVAKLKVEKLSSTQIQQVAKTQNLTIIQYTIISKDNLYIYIIAPDGKITFRKADLTPLNRSLTDFVNSSRNAIGVRGREADINVALTPEKERELQEQRNRSLRQLHQLLIEPIADLLPKDPNQRVVFMPQGELFLVPFPALLNAQNQPLITQHTILTAPSIQTLDLTRKTAQSRPKIDRPALVVGNPTMPSISTVIGDPPRQLSKLPGSEKEAIAIAKQLNTEAITGANAKKDAIVQKMQNAGIIHFATHGLLDSFKGDTPGAIALAPNGTNQSNDGLLTSGELFDLKLNADLVVLSACDTARGDITGDGVIGLSRSLFVAGVPSVIASLWKVPDDSTALLMTEFYRNWKDRKLDKAQALRQAMLTTREKYPEPLYWAAFTLMGEAE